MNTNNEKSQQSTTVLTGPRWQQRTLNTEGAIQYFQEVHGLKVARATLYKRRSLEPKTFPGRRSPFGKLVFDPLEIDRFMATGDARAREGEQGTGCAAETRAEE